MKHRCALLLAGAAAWGLCALATAETKVYSSTFETDSLDQLAEWNFDQVGAGAPVLMSTTPQTSLLPNPLRFLAEFGGNDVVHLTLALPQNTVSVRLRFDAYLLRTWDGRDTPYGGPDVFGYGMNGSPQLNESFSNGAGLQSYCPFAPSNPCEQTWASDGALKDKLGVYVELDPAEGSTIPAKGTPMSLVYHFDTEVPYSGPNVTFDFFSRGLQVHEDLPNKVIDESWGLNNVVVTAQVVPEPQTFALLLAGVLLTFVACRRSRFPH